jgi:plasmid stabilization system protein ParE
MPKVIYSPGAILDLKRLRDFLLPKNPQAARRAAEIILKNLKLLSFQPEIGRLIDELPDPFREWPIGYGDSGYLVRYRYDGDQILIIAIRHQKEVGF